MGRFRAAVAPMVVGITILGWAAEAIGQQASDNEEALRKRVEDLEQKVRSLEQLIERIGQPATAALSEPVREPPLSPSSSEQALKQQVEALDQQVRILGRNEEIEQEAAAAKAKETPTVAVGKDGFSVTSADKAFRFRLGALLQADARFFFDQPPGSQPDQFLIRRARPILEGTFYEKYGFRIMPDFAGGQTQLYDAYVDANFDPAARLRVGKFKPPVGLERLESAADLAFVERAFPTNLVPTRDIGGQLSGDLLGGTLYYALGVFDGAVDGGMTDGDNNDAKDFDARLFAHPFKKSSVTALQGLGIGVAYTTGQSIGHDQQRQSADLQDPRSAELLHLRGRRVRGRLARTLCAPALLLLWSVWHDGRVLHLRSGSQACDQSAECEQLGLAALCHLGPDR